MFIQLNVYAQADTNKVAIKADTLGKQSWLLQPEFICVGIDPVKAGLGSTFGNFTRLEAVADVMYKKNMLLSSTLGVALGSFNTTNLSYKSTSTGLTLSTCRSLFTKMRSYDYDYAFIGLGYGLALNRISEVKYQFTDIWGQQSGTLPPQTMVLHWAELVAGFNTQLTRRIHAGWRVAGRSMINARRIQGIAPLYIAPYGIGEKITVFNYNFTLMYRIAQ